MTTEYANRRARAPHPTNPMTDYYELLQVSPKADPEIIEAAYRRLALKFHPDHNSAPDAARQMQEINAAYAVLKDPERRAEYDRRPPDPEYSGDWSEDDYVPPRAGLLVRLRHWFGLASGWTRLGWGLSGLAIVTVVFLLVIGNGEKAANGSVNPTSSPTSQTPALPAKTLFLDDFENPTDLNWKLDAPWHLTRRYSASGRQSLWFGDEARGRYSPNLNISATLLQPVDLSAASSPILRFRLTGQSDYTQIPNGEDRLFVEVATPGQSFKPIFSTNSLYADWQEVAIDLSRWKDKPLQIRIRFSSGTLNSGAGFNGFFVDDVRIDKEP